MADKGRPSLYSKELADELCRRLEAGNTLRQVCKADDMPAESTVRAWALDDYNGFSAQYMRAREIGYMAMADELLDIADDGTNDYMVDHEGKEQYNGDHLQRSRLRVDTRKWLLSKALPKVFGDKLAIGGDEGGSPIQVVIQDKFDDGN